LLVDNFLFYFWWNSPQWARAFTLTTILDHTYRRTTVGRTPLDEWSARRTDLYLPTHNTHNRQTSMPPGGIRTHNLSKRAASDRAATGTGGWYFGLLRFKILSNLNDVVQLVPRSELRPGHLKAPVS